MAIDPMRPPSFRSLFNVLEHLKGAGYQVSKSKLYRDKSAGKIRVEEDGTVLESEVRAYAATHLNKDIASLEDPTQLQAEKVELEKQKLQEQIAKLRFSREREMGLYVPREEVDTRMVAIMVAIDQAVRQMIDLSMVDLIEKAEGNVKRVNVCRDFMEGKLDETLNQLANTDQFSIQFTDFEDLEETPMEDPTP